MFLGSLRFDLLLGDVHSLKHKRAVVRPLLAALRRIEVTVAETGATDLHRRAEIGVAVVSGDATHCSRLLDACERAVADNPEVTILAVRRRIWDDEDE